VNVNSVSSWLFVVLVLAAAALALIIVFRRRRAKVPEDDYTQALEKWLAGDLAGARKALRAAIDHDPSSVDPYLQLGNLLRKQGDAQRAAVIHRGLTVRGDIPATKRLSISLALADDLLALSQWSEAKSVLDSLEAVAGHSARFWRARFAQCLGLRDEAAAARALHTAAARMSGPEKEIFRRQSGLFQLDRALHLTRAGETDAAKRLLKDVPPLPELAAKTTFVRALIAAQIGDIPKAIKIATEGLMDAPQEMALFLPALQQALLESGHYERSIPILESACQSENAPASLWIALALLYEKMDEREKAVRLLEDKAQDPRLTPDVAAPLLKLLAGENRTSPWGRIWQTLHLPATTKIWRCLVCGHVQEDVRWFCPACHSFDSHQASSP
jgi:lipopolysaccharide biosynthesis regulator YciM